MSDRHIFNVPIATSEIELSWGRPRMSRQNAKSAFGAHPGYNAKGPLTPDCHDGEYPYREHIKRSDSRADSTSHHRDHSHHRGVHISMRCRSVTCMGTILRSVRP